MNDLQKDILTSAVFITGLIGFISGEFIISSTLFASAAIASNVNLNRKRSKVSQFWCYRLIYPTLVIYFFSQLWHLKGLKHPHSQLIYKIIYREQIYLFPVYFVSNFKYYSSRLTTLFYPFIFPHNIPQFGPTKFILLTII